MREQTGCPVLPAAQRVGQLRQRRRPPQALGEGCLQSMCGAQLLGSAGWQVHCSQMLRGRRTDEGANPEKCIGREPVASRVVEPFNCGDQPDAWLPTGTYRLLITPVNALKS